MAEHYTKDLFCSNCDDYRNKDHKIPKGVKLEEYLKKTECPNCEVKGVLKESPTLYV